jgi:hypothetical protein
MCYNKNQTKGHNLTLCSIFRKIFHTLPISYNLAYFIYYMRLVAQMQAWVCVSNNYGKNQPVCTDETQY